VNIGGRVVSGRGRGVSGALVALVEADGSTRISRTHWFGYYRLANVAAGSTVVVSVRHKQYNFAPQVISVSDNITDLNFTAENLF
jgi:hypothetical protein